MPDNEHYSNPMAPANYRPHDEGESGTGHPLTNDDFRKLLMTPAAPGAATGQRYHGASSSTNQQKSSTTHKGEGSTEASDKRKKKKQYYAKVIREEKAREEERAKKYRDRARERREVTANEDQYDMNVSVNVNQQAASTGNYKSVAPDAKGNFDAAIRRKQMIDESKFLGGDLEHTHLVKGLDYALLQKVRAEIGHDDVDNDQINLNKDEHMFVKPSTKITPIGSGANIEKKKGLSNENSTPTPSTPLTPEEEEEQKLGLKSPMAKNIFRILFRPSPRRVNELFLPHRMAYIIDLENSDGQQENENDKGTHALDDIPTTLIRSKADCPNAETTTTMSNNDIVINKLTQILSYLRHSKRDLKRQKKKGTGIFTGLEPEMNIKPTHDSMHTITNKAKEISMYDDIGDYIPDIKRRSTTNERNKNPSESDHKKKAYFHHDSKSNDRKSNHDDPDQNNSNNAEAVKSFIRNVHNKYNAKNEEERTTTSSKSNKKNKNGFQLKFDDDSYAECYPGTMAEEDVNIDSDDEPDFDKMDMGSKKGPVGRWDFDTAEEYSDYMGQKEAMPKAAFQYGVKMNDGRKTRRGVGPKDEKQKLEREWQQISKIIDSKRKGDATGSNSPDSSASKRTKMD
jgi:IK cytokine